MEGLNPLALFVFAGFKYGFYVLAARWLNSWYQSKVEPSIFAGVRTLAGLILGVGLLVAVNKFGGHLEQVAPILIGIGRFAQWLALLIFFYDRSFKSRGKTTATAFMGTVYSTALDLPAALLGVFAGVIPIC